MGLISSPGLQTETQKAFRTVLLAVLLLGWVLALIRVGERSLWADEGYTAYLAQAEGGLANLRRDHSPLHQLLLMGIVRGSRSELALRFPSALAAVLSLPVVYQLGRRLFSPASGLVAAFLLAISPFAVDFAQEARSYALLQFLACLSLLLLLRALERPIPLRDAALQSPVARLGWFWRWAAYAAVAALMLYTHYFGWLMLGAEVLFAAVVLLRASLQSRCPDPRFVALGASLFGIGLLYLPWAPSLISYWQRQGPGAGSLPPGLEVFQLSRQFFGSMVFFFGPKSGGWRFYLFGAAALVGIATLAFQKRLNSLAALALWLAVPIAFLAVVRSNHFFEFRYLIFQLPAFLLLVAHGIGRLAHAGLHLAVQARCGSRSREIPAATETPLESATSAAQSRAGARHAVLAVGLVALFFVPANFPALQTFFAWEKENWRVIAPFVRENVAAGEIVYVSPRYWAYALLYYEPGLESYLVGGTAENAAQLQEMSAGRPGVWFLRYAGPIGDTTGQLTEWITERRFQRLIDGSECGHGITVFYRRFDEVTAVREEDLVRLAAEACQP